MLGAPLLADERVLFFEARKFISLDPLAPFQLPLGGSGTWRPLLGYVYWLDSGTPSFVSHGINLLLHVVLVVLGWRWMSGLVKPRAALMGSCLFACHSAHVASAGWVAGRADLLMSLCVVLALLAQQKSRVIDCMLAAALAVLCKETGVVVVPALFLLAWRVDRASSRRWVIPMVASTVVLPLFVVSVLRAEVAPSYLPSWSSLSTGLLMLPAFVVELIVPLFRPIGLGHGWRDLVGLLLGLPAVVTFAFLGFRGPQRATWLLGLALASLALLPVLHVLPNDGGQWYLLLPSLGIAMSWGLVLSDQRLPRQLAVAFTVLLFLHCTWESSRWAEASVRVDEMIEEARRAKSTTGTVPKLPAQEPREWPHMGPSLCCGFPYQLFEELPPR